MDDRLVSLIKTTPPYILIKEHFADLPQLLLVAYQMKIPDTFEPLLAAVAQEMIGDKFLFQQSISKKGQSIYWFIKKKHAEAKN